MGLFGPPNIEKMKAKEDVKGLLKALGYQKDSETRKSAVKALDQIAKFTDRAANDALIEVLFNDPDRAVRQAVANVISKNTRLSYTRQGITQLLNAVGRSQALDKLLLDLLLHARADLLEVLGYENGKSVYSSLGDYFVLLHDRSDIDGLFKMVMEDTHGEVQRIAATTLGKLSQFITTQQLTTLLDLVHNKKDRGTVIEKIILDVLASNEPVLLDLVHAKKYRGTVIEEIVLDALPFNKPAVVKVAADDNTSPIVRKRAEELLLEFTATRLIEKGQYAQAVKMGAAAVRPFSRAIRRIPEWPSGTLEQLEKRRELANWMKLIDDPNAMEPLIKIFDDARDDEEVVLVHLFDKFDDVRATEPLYKKYVKPERLGGNIEFIRYAISVYHRLKYRIDGNT